MIGQDKFNGSSRTIRIESSSSPSAPSYTPALLQALGAGFGGFTLAGSAFSQNTGVIARGNPTLLNKAKNIIFVLLEGAPSHIDTFDLKMIDGVTPPVSNRRRSMAFSGHGAHAEAGQQRAGYGNCPIGPLLGVAAQSWSGLGPDRALARRALGDIAPNIGSIFAVEKKAERKPTDSFPTFLGLNANDMIGSGYLNASYAPVKFVPAQSGFPTRTTPMARRGFNPSGICCTRSIPSYGSVRLTARIWRFRRLL